MRLGTRAVVLGGSVAGLCAAGAVASHFDEVVVVERDTLPPDARHRRGVPQGKHPHFLLNSGRRAMERLFPGFEDALIEAGGLHLMPSMAAAHCEGAGWVPRRASSMTMVYGSRILIERVLRDRVRALSNVSLREDDRVIVTMGSWGHRMPRENDEFVAAAGRTRAPAFAWAMRQCEPLSDVFVTRSTGNKWRRFDLLDDPPIGLVAIGDAVCAFNPLYAQGMSSAGRSAVLLAGRLSAASSLDREFFRAYLDEQRESLNVAWTLALARDQGYHHATGTEVAPRWRQRLVGRMSWPIFNLISATARDDAVVEQHFARVFNLDESITEMSRSPRVIFGLLRYAVKHVLGRTALPIGFDHRLDPPAHDFTDGPVPGLRDPRLVPEERSA